MRRRKRKWCWMLPRGRAHALGPLSGGFCLFLAGRNLRGGLRGGIQQNIHQFSRCALPGSWSALIGQWQGRESLVIAVGSGISPTWFCSFSGPGDETQLRPRCYLWGGKARGGEVTLGVRFLFSQFCTLPGTQASHAGDHLHLAVNCSATVLSYLPQFPYSTW